MKLTVLSWNILGGKHREQVISFLQHTEWDIAALQEVTQRETHSKVVNDAKEIADALNCEYYYKTAFRTDRHTPVYDLGNCLLSKLPIQKGAVYPLSDLSTYQRNSTTEPRNAVEISIAVNDNTLRCFSTHIGYDDSLGEGELQKKQIQTLLKITPRENAIVMGDFNSSPTSSVLNIVEKTLVHTDTQLTAMTWTNLKKETHPQHRIDYIFTTPDIQTTEFEILESDASDHKPIRAVVEI